MKISPAGKLVYSALLGTGKSACFGGSSCIASESTFANVSGVAADASGTATVAGLQGGADNKNSGYVARMAADGSKLLWSTTVPMGYGDGNVRSLFMAQDSAGNVDLFGGYESLQPALPVTFGPPGLFAAQLKADGSGLNYSMDLGTAADASAAGMVVDASGVAWLAGTSSSGRFPALAAGYPSLGPNFVLRLDASGAVEQPIFRLPHGTITAAPLVSPAGFLLLLGAHAALVTFSPAYALDAPAVVGFANAASLEANTGLYAGALVTIYGFNLPNQTRFNGNPPPYLYWSSNQINLQVPFENYQGTVSLNWDFGS